METEKRTQPTASAPKIFSKVSSSLAKSRPRWIKRCWSSAGLVATASRIFSFSWRIVVEAEIPGNTKGRLTLADGDTTWRLKPEGVSPWAGVALASAIVAVTLPGLTLDPAMAAR